MTLNFNTLGLEPVGWVGIYVTSTNMVGGKVDFPPTYSSLRTAPLRKTLPSDEGTSLYNGTAMGSWHRMAINRNGFFTFLCILIFWMLVPLYFGVLDFLNFHQPSSDILLILPTDPNDPDFATVTVEDHIYSMFPNINACIAII